MASTYELIETTTLSSAASSVSFSSITQDYRDLVLVVDVKANSGTVSNTLRFNNDTASNYEEVYMVSDQGSFFSGGDNSSGISMGLRAATDTKKSLAVLQVMDYSATDKHKTCLGRAAERAGEVVTALAGRWANTDAVSTVTVSAAINDYAAGSTFSLYGIAS